MLFLLPNHPANNLCPASGRKMPDCSNVAQMMLHFTASSVFTWNRWNVLCNVDNHYFDGIWRPFSNKNICTNILERRHMKWDGNISTGRSPADPLPDHIGFLACIQSNTRANVLHASTALALPKASDFLFNIFLDYVSANASVQTAKRSASTSQPEKSLWCGRSELSFAVEKVPENRSPTSSLEFENWFPRFPMQLMFIWFRRTNRHLCLRSFQLQWRILSRSR